MSTPEVSTTKSDLGGRAARGVRWSMLDQVLQQIVRLLLTLLLTRLTGPEAYGLIGIAFLFTGLATFVGDLGLGTAVVQRKELSARHVDTAVTVTLVLGIVAAAVLVLASPAIGRAFDEPMLGPVLAWVSLNFPTRSVAGVLRDVLRRELHFGAITLANGVAVLISGVAGAVVAITGGGVWALVVYSAGEGVILVVAMAVAQLVSGRRLPRLRIEREPLRDMFGFGMYVTGFKLLYYAQLNLDNLLVGKFLGASALGIYGLAYRLMLYPLQKVGDVVSNVALPVFSKVVDQPRLLSDGYFRGLTAVSLFTFPVSIGLAVSAPLVIPWALGEQWTSAVLVVQILAANGPRLALTRLGTSLFQSIDRPQWDFWLGLGGMVVYVVAFVIGLQHGVVGMAVAYTVAGHLLLVPNQILICLTPLQRPMGMIVDLWPIALASVGLAAAAWGTMQVVPGTGTLATLTVVAAGAAGYFAVLAVAGRELLRQTRRSLTRS